MKPPAEGRTAWEHFNWLWETHGHGSAKSWVKAYMGHSRGNLFIFTKRQMLKGKHPWM